MEYILSLSYGKDSMACLGAIEKLNLPLDRIVSVEVWATKDVHGDLPEMIEFKSYADKIIKDRYGISVEHICAAEYDMYGNFIRNKNFEDDVFYKIRKSGKRAGEFSGWPAIGYPACNAELKRPIFRMIGRKGNVQYLGIAADEKNRHNQLGEKKVSPLVLAGWTENDCYNWCVENELLSPIYSISARGGCWFCQNQSIQQLRTLRNNYPDLWEIMLRLDKDSPNKFISDGRTIHDCEKRFFCENAGLLDPKKRFMWKNLDKINIPGF